MPKPATQHLETRGPLPWTTPSPLDYRLSPINQWLIDLGSAQRLEAPLNAQESKAHYFFGAQPHTSIAQPYNNIVRSYISITVLYQYCSVLYKKKSATLFSTNWGIRDMFK